MVRKPKKDGAAEAAPKTDISEDQLQALFFQSKKDYERALGVKQKADADFKNCCRRIKAELGKRGVEEIKLAISLGGEAGEASVKANIESQLRILRWMGVAIGTQGDLFPDNDPTPITDRAFAEGRRHGLAGESRANPHHHTTEAARSYEAGYAKGQEEKLRAGIKPLDNTPTGSVPRDQWQEQTAKDNERVQEDIKRTSAELQASAALGSSRPTFQVQ